MACLVVLPAAALAGPLALITSSSPAHAADRDTPAAREEREHRWRQERQERRDNLKNQQLQEKNARERRDGLDAQRERDWQQRRKSLDELTRPENPSTE